MDFDFRIVIPALLDRYRRRLNSIVYIGVIVCFLCWVVKIINIIMEMIRITNSNIITISK